MKNQKKSLKQRCYCTCLLTCMILFMACFSACGGSDSKSSDAPDNQNVTGEIADSQMPAENDSVGDSVSNVQESDANNTSDVADITVDYNVEDFTIFGKHFKEWTYDSLMEYIKNNSTEDLANPGTTYTIYDGSGNLTALIRITGYQENTKSDEITIETCGLFFKFGEKTDGSGTNWMALNLQSPIGAQNHHVISDIIGKPMDEFVDTFFGEGAYQTAIDSIKTVQRYDDAYLVAASEKSITMGFGNEIIGLYANDDGSIQSVSYTSR